MNQVEVVEAKTELETLTERKQELALRVVNGDDSARGELMSVVSRIAEIEQEAELRQLAEAERRRLAELAEQERKTAERRLGLKRLNALRTEQNQRMRKVDDQITKLADIVGETITAHREIYGLATELQVAERWRVPADIAARLRAALFPSLGLEIGYEQPITRRSLVRDGKPKADKVYYKCAHCGNQIEDSPLVKHNCSMLPQADRVESRGARMKDTLTKDVITAEQLLNSQFELSE